MATYSHTITLQDQGGAYPLLASQTMQHGDTIYITVNTGFSATVNTFTETGSAVPNLGNSHTTGSAVSWTIPNSGYSNGDVINISFFASNGTPYWQHVTDYRGYVQVTISVVASCAGNPSSITSVTPDIYGESQQTQATTSRVYAGWGTNCTAQIYVTQGGWNSGWLNGVYFTPTRGNSYTYYARSAGFSGSTAGVSAYTPYLATDYIINQPSNLTTSDGTWTQTLSGIGSPTNYNNYSLADGNTTSANQYAKANGSSLSTGVGNTTIVNDNANNSPPGQTRTFYVWASRTSTSGGNGGQGWPTSWQICKDSSNNDISFTVTRAATNTESIQSTAAGDAHDSQTGFYHENSSPPSGGSGELHRVRLAGIQEGKHYDFRDSSTGTGTPIQGHVFLNTDGSAWENVDWPLLRASGSSQTNFSRRVWDQTATIPSTTGSNTTTYYLWRADDSSGTNAAYTGASYTRTLVSYDRYGGLEDRSLTGTATSYTLTITNALKDMTYYVKSGSFTGSILASASPSSNGNLVMTITPDSIPNVGNSTTNYLTVSSEHNAFPTVDYSSGHSWTITRAGSGGSGATGNPTGDYGLKIRNSSGNVIYDTESRMARFVTSGTAPSSGTLSQNQSATVSVTGMLNTSDWNVVVLPTTGASSSSYFGYTFTVAKATNQFTITNTSATANSYKYYIVKSGG